jgi:hypothetical protein
MNITAKTWELVLYPDNERHKEVIDELWLDNEANPNRSDFVGILHDRDFNEVGELKKPHYHIIFSYDNTTTLGQMCSRFPNIETSLFTKKDNRKQALLYLTHQSSNAKAEGKTLYDKTELFGNPLIISKAYKTDHESNVETLLLYIENTPKKELSFTNVMHFAIDNGMCETLRKYSFLLKEVIMEVKKCI